MNSDWTQDGLDQWIGNNAEARQGLMNGLVPKHLTEGGPITSSGFSFLGSLYGALAGAALGFVIHALQGDHLPIGRLAFTLISSAFVAIAVSTVFRRQWAKLGLFGDKAVPTVRSETLDFTTETSNADRTFLRVTDGRRFLVSRPSKVPFSGRFRVYFVDTPMPGGTDKSDENIPGLYVLGFALA